MQEVPSDVLLLTIDYLDSPTMINCRQVSRKWLDVVDGNRSLYSFFYLPRDSKPFSQQMFDLFTERSVSGLRAVSINQKVDEPEIVIDSLLNSNSGSTLRYFLLDNHRELVNFNPVRLSGMEKLQSFSYFSTLSSYYTTRASTSTRFRLRNGTRTHLLPSNAEVPCSLTSFHLLDDRFRDYSSQEFGWCSASIKHLAIMVRGRGPFETLQFPNLQVLELHCYSEPCRFSSESCPNLKAIYLGAFFVGFPVLIKGLPASLEKIWLSWSSLDLESDLQALDSSLPHLEDLRFENKFGSDSKILGFIRARRSAAEQGAEVGGIKMKPIKKLTFRRRQFSNEDWLALEGLVEELVDLKDAPDVVQLSV